MRSEPYPFLAGYAQSQLSHNLKGAFNQARLSLAICISSEVAFCI